MSFELPIYMANCSSQRHLANDTTIVPKNAAAVVEASTNLQIKIET